MNDDLIYTGRTVRLTVRDLRTVAVSGTETPATSGVTGTIGLYDSDGTLVVGSGTLSNDDDDWYVEVDAPAAGTYQLLADLDVGGKTYRSSERVRVYAWEPAL